MLNIDKQITYWQEGAKEDWEVALELVSNDRLHHGLFFAHLVVGWVHGFGLLFET